MSPILDWKDGWLSLRTEAILDPQGDTPPLLNVLWYPFAEMSEGRARRDYPLGVPMLPGEAGVYYFIYPDDPSRRKQSYQLTDGGRTMPIAVENTPILPPDNAGAVVKTKKRMASVPMGRAPFERIIYGWDTRRGRWVKDKEFISEREAEDMGIEW